MGNDELTIEILKGIRDEARQTNARLDQMGGRIDETNSRLDELGRRVVESEVRTATALTDVTGSLREITGLLRAQNDLRPRVERCEKDIAELRKVVGR